VSESPSTGSSRPPDLGQDHVDGELARLRQQDFVRGDLHVFEPGAAELLRDPVSQLAIPRRSRGVRLKRQQPVGVANPNRIRKAEKRCFEREM
jgi:hypothetical protein